MRRALAALGLALLLSGCIVLPDEFGRMAVQRARWSKEAAASFEQQAKAVAAPDPAVMRLLDDAADLLRQHARMDEATALLVDPDYDAE